MAKVKFGGLIAEIRNSINGWTFARNRGGAYIRTKITPTNPQTLAQILVRARLAFFAQAWRSLTEEQRNAWSAAVSNWETTDVFGDIITPTGNTLYTRLNAIIQAAGGTPLVNPPTPLGAAAITALSVTADAVGETMPLVIEPIAVPADHAMVIETTPNVSAGVSSVRNRYTKLAVVEAGQSTAVDIYEDYTIKYGTLLVGQKLFVRARFVRLATGERSQAVANFTIVE